MKKVDKTGEENYNSVIEGDDTSKLEELYQYKDEVILIYCAKGQSSAIVCKYLESKGFSNVYNLLNGINNYISKGE